MALTTPFCQLTGGLADAMIDAMRWDVAAQVAFRGNISPLFFIHDLWAGAGGLSGNDSLPSTTICPQDPITR